MAQTKKTPKDTQTARTAQSTDQPDTGEQPEDLNLEGWFHEEILTRLGPISGKALITASHAHGDRRLDWMAECLEVQGQADLAAAYQQRKGDGNGSLYPS